MEQIKVSLAANGKNKDSGERQMGKRKMSPTEGGLVTGHKVETGTITFRSANALVTKQGETYEVDLLLRQTSRPCLRRLARHHHNCLGPGSAHTSTTSETACLACSTENDSTL